MSCEECAENQKISDRLAEILTQTANALKGPPPDLVWHSWHDLPEWATKYRQAILRFVKALQATEEAGDDPSIPTGDFMARIEEYNGAIEALVELVEEA